MWRGWVKTLNEICNSYKWGVKITRAPLTKFHLCEFGGRAAPYEIWTWSQIHIRWQITLGKSYHWWWVVMPFIYIEINYVLGNKINYVSGSQSLQTLSWLGVSLRSDIGEKWACVPNLQTMKQNAFVLKLFSKMSLFFKLNIFKIKLYVYF